MQEPPGAAAPIPPRLLGRRFGAEELGLVRYLIVSDQGVLGAMGFGAAAWKVQARDAWIGWDQAQRRTRLHLVLNQTRFLIGPWVRCPNLGSKVLALAARSLGADFQDRYGYAPGLLETFVPCDHFTGAAFLPTVSWSSPPNACRSACGTP